MPPGAFPTSKHTPVNQECSHKPCQLRDFARDYVMPPSQSSDTPQTGYSPIWETNPTRRRPETRLTQDRSPSQFSDNIELRALAVNVAGAFQHTSRSSCAPLLLSGDILVIWNSETSATELESDLEVIHEESSPFVYGLGIKHIGSSCIVKSQLHIPAIVRLQQLIQTKVNIIGRTLTEITPMREEALAVESGRKVDMDVPTKSEQGTGTGIPQLDFNFR
ncbi:hypothetical protein C8R45DRAFT_1187127 [Mycena sanguinolenta]|nr:hypothetical protein C8R45DRAFT_1187127 [Mycena sanguinolenta]